MFDDEVFDDVDFEDDLGFHFNRPINLMLNVN